MQQRTHDTAEAAPVGGRVPAVVRLPECKGGRPGGVCAPDCRRLSAHSSRAGNLAPGAAQSPYAGKHPTQGIFQTGHPPSPSFSHCATAG